MKKSKADAKAKTKLNLLEEKILAQLRNNTSDAQIIGTVEERFSTAWGIILIGVHCGWHLKSSLPQNTELMLREFRECTSAMKSIISNIRPPSYFGNINDYFEEYGEVRANVQLMFLFHHLFQKMRETKPKFPQIKKADSRLKKFSDTLSLSAVEFDLLRLSVAMRSDFSKFQKIYDEIPRLTKKSAVWAVSIGLGHKRFQVEEAMQAYGNLDRFGILKHLSETHMQKFEDWLKCKSSIWNWLNDSSGKFPLPIGSHRHELKNACVVADYPHLKLEVELTIRLLLQAQQAKEKIRGINILLWGPPGTGKTELAHAIANHIRFDLYSIDSQRADGSPLDAEDRLGCYRCSQCALSSNNNAILLFDEAEDVIGFSVSGGFSSTFVNPSNGLRGAKAFANSLLEENEVPAIWTTNAVECMDPAWLRRFSFIIEVPIPPEEVRTKIVQKHMRNLPISIEMQEALARSTSLSPGHLATLARTVKVASPISVQDADNTCQTILRTPLRLLTGHALLPSRSRYCDYDPMLLNIQGSLPKEILEVVKSTKSGKFLLSGPPGTGKTGLAHFVAREINKEIINKTASDLLSCYLGGTEKNIASMFEEAKERDAVLILDEADSFLQNRTNAVRSWEITQVNEFLARMEDFSGVFFCSTNFNDHLDPAAMRRFLFKIQFDYLTQAQIILMTERILPNVSWENPAHSDFREALLRIKLLTPADFANVKHRKELLNQELTLAGLVEALKFEVSCKHEKQESNIGFTNNRV